MKGRCGLCFGPIAEGVQGGILTTSQRIIPIVSYGGVLFSRNSDGHPGSPLTPDGLIDWDKMCRWQGLARVPEYQSASVSRASSYPSVIHRAPRPFRHQGPTPVSMAQPCVSASYHSCTSHPQGSQDASAVPGTSQLRPYPIYGQPAEYDNWGASEEVVSYSETHSSVEGPSVDLSSLNSGSVYS